MEYVKYKDPPINVSTFHVEGSYGFGALSALTCVFSSLGMGAMWVSGEGSETSSGGQIILQDLHDLIVTTLFGETNLKHVRGIARLQT